MNKNRCLLAVAAELFGDLQYIIDSARRFSYRQCHLAAANCVQTLKQSSISRGDLVAVSSPTTAEYIVLLHALWRVGAIACPINPKFPPEYANQLLRDIGCCHIISLAETGTGELTEGFKSLDMNEVVDLNSDRASDDLCPVSFDQAATVIFTSGSTGRPKGVQHRYGSHIYSAIGSNQNITLDRADRWHLSLPLFHIGGLAILFRVLLTGAAVVISEKEADFGSVIQKNLISHISLVTTQLYRLLDDAPASQQLSQLKAILLGGGPISNRLIKKALNLKLPIYTSYGLTEMASQVTTTNQNASATDLNSSGKLLPARELNLDDDGTIMVRGETLFSGYRNSEGLERPFDNDGWFHTSDLARIDEFGNFHVIGRADNIFISGGENVQPELVEAEVTSIVDTRQVVVVPIEDEEFGQRPFCFIEGEFDPEYLTAELRKKLPSYMLPVRISAWPSHLLGSAVKVSRAELTKYAAKLVEDEA